MRNTQKKGQQPKNTIDEVTLAQLFIVELQKTVEHFIGFRKKKYKLDLDTTPQKTTAILRNVC